MTSGPDDTPEAAARAHEDAALQERIEQILKDARRARSREIERDDTVAFVRELGFEDLLED